MAQEHHVTAVIAAGGTGSRLGNPGGKQLLDILNKPVVAWSVDAIASADQINDIIVVCDPERVDEYASLISKHLVTHKPVSYVGGGSTRTESVYSGLIAADKADIVAVHDGARPLVSPEVVDGAIAYLEEHTGIGGVVVGHPSYDTLKVVEDGIIVDTPPRNRYWVAQTPQIFWRDRFLKAYKYCESCDFSATDDSSLVEKAGFLVAMYEGARDNVKVTVAEDVAFVESVLKGSQCG